MQIEKLGIDHYGIRSHRTYPSSAMRRNIWSCLS